MRSRITRKALIIGAIVLAFGATAVTSSAYFSDYEVAKGQAGLHLSGETVIHEEWAEQTKDIWIENTGTTNVVVRVGIFGADKFMKTPEPEIVSDWKQDGNFWYYQQVLKPGQSTSHIRAKVYAEGQKVDIDYLDFDIVVVHESAPAALAATETPTGWNGSLIPSASNE